MKLLKILGALVREHVAKAARSGHWRAVRRHHLAEHGSCAACAGRSLLQVHHVRPFARDPGLELDPGNLLTLCAAGLCHLELGHGHDYEHYNPQVREDCVQVLAAPETRAAVAARARVTRLPVRVP